MKLYELYLIQSSEYLVKVFQEKMNEKVFTEILSGPEMKLLAVDACFEPICKQLIKDQKWIEIQMNNKDLLLIQKYSKEFYVHLN